MRRSEHPISPPGSHIHPSSVTGRLIWFGRTPHVQMARASCPCSSVQHPSAMSRTRSCAARALDVLSRRGQGQSRRTARERSCDARRQHEVRALMHMGRGPTIAAHLSTRPAPTTAGPSSEAINDRAPLKSKELRQGGSGHLGPDAPAGQKLIMTAVSKAMAQGWRAQGSNLQVHRSHWSQRRPPTPLQHARATC